MKTTLTLPILVLLFSLSASAGQLSSYQLTIENTWSADTHPENFPTDAHFSWLGGGTHNSNITFWELGEMASPGMVLMAETGVTHDHSSTTLEDEFQTAIDNGAAYSETIFEKIYTPEILPGPGSRVTSFNMDSDFPLISLATMLGPSPDWFVGVSGLALFENG